VLAVDAKALLGEENLFLTLARRRTVCESRVLSSRHEKPTAPNHCFASPGEVTAIQGWVECVLLELVLESRCTARC
jgi:hypothetical protein